MISTIANYSLCVYFDGNPKKQSTSKFLLQVSVKELHNSMVGPSEEGVLKETREK